MEEQNFNPDEERERHFNGHEHHSHESNNFPEHREPHINNNPDKKNPWMVATAVLAVISAALLIIAISGSVTGNVISGDEAGKKTIDYLNSRVGGGVEYLSYEDLGDLYKINCKYQGQEIPVYVTKDGEYFVQGTVEMNAISAAQTETAAQPPKSDIPKVELFIWGYCPYGVQAQGPLAEVASLLEDNADFETVLYYDGHGPYETQQNKIQACIQEVAKDKYWEYASGFVNNVYPKCSSARDVECDKTESVKLMKSLDIDDSKIMSCVDSKGGDLTAEHSARAGKYGVTGSPTLVINGVKVNTARNAEAFKTSVCEAFNDAPSECSEVLDTTSAAASGNC